MTNRAERIAAAELADRTLYRALARCLSIEEACSAWLLVIDDSDRRQIILDCILEGAQDSPALIAPFLERLLEIFCHGCAKQRQAVSYAITLLAPSCGDRLRACAARELLSSQWKPSRRRGRRLLASSLREGDLSLMESLRGLVPPDEMASLLATCAPPSYLASHIDELAPQVTERWIRRKLFLRAAESDATVIDRLRALDPVSFVYVCTKLERATSAEFMRETYDGRVDPDDRGILLWCMGRQRHWTALLAISDKYDLAQEDELWRAARAGALPAQAAPAVHLSQP